MNCKGSGQLFADYFLEEILTMLRYMPPEKERKKKDKEVEVEDEDSKSKNMNLLASGDATLRQAMSRVSEREIPHDVIEVGWMDKG